MNDVLWVEDFVEKMTTLIICSYLHGYDNFYRQLGCTLVSTTDRPERGRHPSSRSLLSFRDRNDRLSSDSSKTPARFGGKRLGPVKEETSVDTKISMPEKLVREEASNSFEFLYLNCIRLLSGILVTRQF